MSLISLILTLVIVGVLLYLVNRYIPMDGKIKTVINWAVIVIVVIWLIKKTGLLDGAANITI